MNETLVTLKDETLASDLLRGADEIAAFLGESRRRVFYLCERGLIPCSKEGASWISARSALRQHFATKFGAVKSSAA